MYKSFITEDVKNEISNYLDFYKRPNRTYENRGLEIYHLEDLTVVCNECHETFHNDGGING